MKIGIIKQKLVNKFQVYFIRYINLFIPKNENKIVFASVPDFSDNAKGLWEYIITTNTFDAVWLIKNKDVMQKLQASGVKCFLQGSWEANKALITSKFIACTHSQFVELKSKKQVLINLWHGMPLKCMGYLDHSSTEKDINGFRLASKKSDLFVSTSSLMKYVLASCFNMDARKILVSGQPRNDNLFSPVNKDYLSLVLGDKHLQYDKFILYCPTFRSGFGRVDGKKMTLNAFNFEEYDKAALDATLKAHNALLVVKLHPFEEKQYTDLNLPENAILVKSDVFNSNSISLYDILNAFDVLVTDYSSIYFDYLLLNRPIIFVNCDLGEYKNVRGLVFEDYGFWTPGPKTKTFTEFNTQLNLSLENKSYFGNERSLINKLINEHTDNNSSRRVMEAALLNANRGVMP
jgi:CDP-glycerol glycerophosphotransferase